MKTNNFCNTLKAEFFKTKRNIGLIILLCFPIFISVYFFISACSEYAEPSTLGTYLIESYTRNHFSLYALLYPLIVSFAVLSFNNIEYANNCTKLLFTLPVTKHRLFLSKTIVLFFYVTCSLMLAYALLILSINALDILFPELSLNSFDIRNDINMLFLRTFISMIAVMTIQYCLCIVFPNFIVSVSFALFCTVVCFIATNWKYSFLFPYGGVYKALGLFYQEDLHLFHKETIASLIYIVAFYIIGFTIFSQSNRIHKNK